MSKNLLLLFLLPVAAADSTASIALHAHLLYSSLFTRLSNKDSKLPHVYDHYLIAVPYHTARLARHSFCLSLPAKSIRHRLGFLVALSRLPPFSNSLVAVPESLKRPALHAGFANEYVRPYPPCCCSWLANVNTLDCAGEAAFCLPTRSYCSHHRLMGSPAFHFKSLMRKASMTRSDPPQSDELENGNGSAEPTERSGLLNHLQRISTTDSGTPYYKHENPAIRWPAMAVHITWEVLKTNYVNVLLVFVPLGIIAGVLDWSPVLQFVLNFVAIIPLASLLAFATEELAVPLGQTIGGLLNATFGNAVELIVRISLPD